MYQGRPPGNESCSSAATAWYAIRVSWRHHSPTILIMSRRRKRNNDGLLTMLLTSHWGFAAGLAVASMAFFQLLLPAMFSHSPTLSLAVKGLSPLGWLVTGVFGLMAVFRFIQASAARPLGIPADGGRPLRERRASPPVARSEPSMVNRGASTDSSAADVEKASVAGVVPTPLPTDLTVFGVAAGFRGPPKPTDWSLELLQAIDWKRFEEVVAAYFRAKGLRCETQTHGADGGIDARIYAQGSDSPMALVQCKAWKRIPVGVAPVRELLGAMTHEQVARGFFMITGEYSPDALAFAESHRITLVSGPRFIEMVRLQSPEVQARLLAVATEGDYLVPTCASCGVKMVHRGQFWGCAKFPMCRNRIQIAA